MSAPRVSMVFFQVRQGCRRWIPPRSPRSSNTRRSKTFPSRSRKWFGDYQILGSTPTGELEVLLVAIKSDIVEGLFRVA